ncbi:MAG: hypothetical protein HQ567_32310 [Candidatus Nealsonbacteria bacterium]|nr:hypothetical protein [Candidatus Nealsonbacteria bacterium]
MTKRTILLGMISAVLLGGSGCCVMDSIIRRPFGPGTGVDTDHCGPDCPSVSATCQPTLELPYERVRPAPCDSVCPSDCGSGCGSECESQCESQCESECGSECGPCGQCGRACCGPLSTIAALFAVPTWCGNGCGEIYWGDFHGDPPDCCDPCDCHGDYTSVNPGPCGRGCATQAGCSDCGPPACGPTGCGEAVCGHTGNGLVGPTGRVPGIVVNDTKAAPSARVARAPKPSAK